jgi:hypothetical protein
MLAIAQPCVPGKSTLKSFLPLAPGPHRLHPNAGAALGTPPRRELTLTLSRGFTWPRLSVAAGASLLYIQSYAAGTF